MPTTGMHPDEVATDASLVRRLLKAQFPHWADLPISAAGAAGTGNAIYRLGDHLTVRLPRVEWAVADARKEHQWLPRLAPLLPLPVPVLLGQGEAAHGYPWPWSVYRWLDGEDATAAPPADLGRAACDLAYFVRAMQQVTLAGGPPSGRGVPLSTRDSEVRDAISALRGTPDAGTPDAGTPDGGTPDGGTPDGGTLDGGTLDWGSLDWGAATAAWEAAVAAPQWPGPPVWTHGDLLPGNLLVRQGCLSAVLDFGCLGVGDPACDMMVAWTLLRGPSREMFRAAVGADDATWARGRGWALCFALVALPYYRTSNPALAGVARRTIGEVLASETLAR